MSGAQHTPGPWKAVGWEGLCVNAPDPIKGECTITLAAGRHGSSIAELSANARLIAAAPDMHEALHIAHNQMCALLGAGAELQRQARLSGDTHEDARWRLLHEGTQEILRTIEVTLAKVEGGGK
jgi:hypothetical protein